MVLTTLRSRSVWCLVVVLISLTPKTGGPSGEGFSSGRGEGQVGVDRGWQSFCGLDTRQVDLGRRVALDSWHVRFYEDDPISLSGMGLEDWSRPGGVWETVDGESRLVWCRVLPRSSQSLRGSTIVLLKVFVLTDTDPSVHLSTLYWVTTVHRPLCSKGLRRTTRGLEVYLVLGSVRRLSFPSFLGRCLTFCFGTKVPELPFPPFFYPF